MRSMRVFFSNLGCKLNQAELEGLSRKFSSSGYIIATSLEEADIHVVNTCTVTHVAARQSRRLARQGRRLNPKLRTVLTGCYATSDPHEASSLCGVDLIVPNHLKNQLVERVQENWPPHRGTLLPEDPDLPVPYVPLAFGNTRALVKIEDGCNMRCSFCIIPDTRGRQKSRKIGEILEEVQELVQRGSREVVVTGVQISAYRSGRSGLYDLVKKLLQYTRVGRLRLTSIAPWDFDLRLLDLFDHDPPRLCRHFHLSLQSGSATTLRRMRRPYGPSEFGELVSAIRERVPGVAITTDIIVGFPGETEREFQETLNFADRCNFARIHAFPYSSRPGTAAAEFSDQVPFPVKKLRMERLLLRADSTAEKFAEGNLDRWAQVLWEGQRDGRWIGTTDNYIQVSCKSDRDLKGQLSSVDAEDISVSNLLTRRKTAPLTAPAGSLQKP